MICHVEGEVAAHHAQTDQSDIARVHLQRVCHILDAPLSRSRQGDFTSLFEAVHQRRRHLDQTPPEAFAVLGNLAPHP
jgi:hypothetical protein